MISGEWLIPAILFPKFAPYQSDFGLNLFFRDVGTGIVVNWDCETHIREELGDLKTSALHIMWFWLILNWTGVALVSQKHNVKGRIRLNILSDINRAVMWIKVSPVLTHTKKKKRWTKFEHSQFGDSNHTFTRQIKQFVINWRNGEH